MNKHITFAEVSMAITDYDRIERAIKYLEVNFIERPELRDVAKHIGLSEFHFQRVFSRWAGVRC